MEKLSQIYLRPINIGIRGQPAGASLVKPMGWQLFPLSLSKDSPISVESILQGGCSWIGDCQHTDRGL